jgi:hypothetical protein
MLTRGMGVREVAKRIREMHPEDKKLHLTPTTLQKFRKEKLDLNAEALKEIKEAERDKKEVREEKKENTQLKGMPIYKEKLQEAVDLHIDIRQQLANLSVLISARIEAIFDRAQYGNASTNEEQNLQKYFATYITVLEKWAKYIDKIADQTIETNVNITVIEDQMAVIRECIRETLMEVNPELAVKFFSKLERKLSTLSYRAQNTGFGEMHQNVKVLSADVADVVDIEEIVEDDSSDTD